MSGTRTPTRSALARFVPFHFRDPLGLARRLLRSGSPEARFAMASAALGPFLAPLDLLLAVAERRRLARAASPRLPLLFVMGPPRSGTTLVTLSLNRCLPVTYLNNLTALFPRAPITANLLFGRPIRHEGVTLANYYGRTRGVSGPNDCLHLWDRWLGQDRTQIPEQIEAEVIRLMEEVGRGGGYVLSPSHYIQPDTPVANVLTVYRTVARYRGGQPAY